MHRYKYLILFSVSIVLTLAACNSSTNSVEDTLKQAGDNRVELQKVIDHFSAKAEDSLKLEAAQYLIINMYWHYGSLMEPTDFLIDGLLKEDSLVNIWYNELNLPRKERNIYVKDPLYRYQAEEKPAFLEKMKAVYGQKSTKLSDSEYLSASFLINRIEHSFKVWERNRSILQIDFETFKASILPYRLYDETIIPLEQFLDSLYYQRFFDQLSLEDIGLKFSQFNNYFNQFGGVRHNQLDIGPLNFMTVGDMGCKERTTATVNIYRNLGFPVNIDFTSVWLQNPNRHFWSSMRNPDSSLTYFDAGFMKINHGFTDRCMGKVFRQKFEPNIQSLFFKNKNKEQLPSIFNSPFIEDVTNEYLSTKSISIPLGQETAHTKFCYLCVFTPSGWSALAYGEINKKNNTAIFDKMPIGISGVVCAYQNGDFIPISNYLFINSRWEIKEFSANHQKTTDILLTRKYPQKKPMKINTEKLLGAKFQAANKADFSDAVTLDAVTDTLPPYLRLFEGSQQKAYRYYRYISRGAWAHGNAAVVQFLGYPDVRIKSEAALHVSILKPDDQHWMDSTRHLVKYVGGIIGEGKDFDKCFDDNMETFIFGYWGGMDFGKPVKVEKILFAPRNANNGIIEGDHYRLLYWDNKWVDAGEQIAIYNYVEFKNIPSNTLYWLRNLDRGKEELPFIYDQGQQYFINFDSLNIGTGSPEKFKFATSK